MNCMWTFIQTLGVWYYFVANRYIIHENNILMYLSWTLLAFTKNKTNTNIWIVFRFWSPGTLWPTVRERVVSVPNFPDQPPGSPQHRCDDTYGSQPTYSGPGVWSRPYSTVLLSCVSSQRWHVQIPVHGKKSMSSKNFTIK